METLQDVFLRQAIGDGSVAVIDEAAMSAATTQRKAPYVDRRNAAGLAVELRHLEINFSGTERQRRDADELVQELQGQLAKLVAGRKSFEQRASSSDRSRELLARADAKIADVERALDDRRIGARADLDRLTRIAASRREQVEAFKKMRPFPELKTNEEILMQDVLDEKFAELLDAHVSGIRQPSVGRVIERAG
jgi:chromosome segregation ATPase